MSETEAPTPATDDGVPRYQRRMDRSLGRMFAATVEMQAAAVGLREAVTDSPLAEESTPMEESR